MKIVKTVTLWLLLCVCCYSNDLYVNVPMLRTDTIGGILGDIDSRIYGTPQYDWTNYRDDDKVTWAHEGTHSVNAKIRLDNHVRNGFYLTDGQGIVLSQPNFTLKELANKVPLKERGRLYKLYLIEGQKYWNDVPFYCIDELSAYINGCLVGVEYNITDRTKHSYINAVEMYGYSIMAYNICKEEKYQDLNKLRKLLDILQQRLISIRKTIK